MFFQLHRNSNCIKKTSKFYFLIHVRENYYIYKTNLELIIIFKDEVSICKTKIKLAYLLHFHGKYNTTANERKWKILVRIIVSIEFEILQFSFHDNLLISKALHWQPAFSIRYWSIIFLYTNLNSDHVWRIHKRFNSLYARILK